MPVITKERAREIQSHWKLGMFCRDELEEWFDNPHEYSDFGFDGEILSDDTKYKEIGLSKRKDLMCVFWGQRENTLAYLLTQDKKDFRKQLKQWRKDYRQGKIVLRKENNRDLEYKGRKFYSFILQPTKDGGFGPDGTQLLWGLFADGLIYAWTSKQNRDKIYNYIISEKDDSDTDEENDKLKKEENTMDYKKLYEELKGEIFCSPHTHTHEDVLKALQSEREKEEEQRKLLGLKPGYDITWGIKELKEENDKLKKYKESIECIWVELYSAEKGEYDLREEDVAELSQYDKDKAEELWKEEYGDPDSDYFLGKDEE